MKKSSRYLVATLALASLLLAVGPRFAFAEQRHAGLFAYGGYSLYAMGDVNDNIDSPSSFLGPISATADHVTNGWNAGGGFRLWMAPTSYLEFGVGYLNAGTSGSGTLSGTNYTGDLNVSGLGLTLSFGSLRWSAGKTRLGLGAGGGYYFTPGSVSVSSPGFSGSTDIEGSGPGFHGALLVDRPLGSTLHLDAALGYRYAKTTSVRALGGDVLNEDGSKATIDWSGPFLRVGLALYPRGSG